MTTLIKPFTIKGNPTKSGKFDFPSCYFVTLVVKAVNKVINGTNLKKGIYGVVLSQFVSIRSTSGFLFWLPGWQRGEFLVPFADGAQQAGLFGTQFAVFLLSLRQAHGTGAAQ